MTSLETITWAETHLRRSSYLADNPLDAGAPYRDVDNLSGRPNFP